MNKTWNYISYLGLTIKFNSLDDRSKVISNQINFAMLLFMFILFIFNTIERELENGVMTIGSIRVIIVLFFNALNIFLASKKLHEIQKIILIFIPTFVILIFPTLIGFVEEESFFYYPYIIIAFSIVPQLILPIGKKRLLFSISMAYFLILILFCDNFLVFKASSQPEVVKLIKTFYVNYKVIPILLYLFFNFSIYYLRRLNTRFENEIMESNQELNSAIEELRVTQQHLVQSEKMASLGTLTAGIAHEINNPLNFINGGIEIINNIKSKLKDKEFVEQCNVAIDIIREGVERASTIISSLMTFSYRGKPKLMKTDLAEIVERTLLFLKTKTTEDIQIIKRYDLDKEIAVYQDKIHQVLLNVVDNAIYAVNLNKGEKIINIVISEENEKNKKYAVIAISNNGPRIHEEELKQLFDPFFTTKDPGKGTGLGLSICYSLIKEHNGTIEAKNIDDKVVFTLKLPF